ncbi:hypothetical protein, partial [Staphylococcus gallinarum]|uniref:hypothetical protein n=1 Tax=Staphylococcus gallinarum TaxID=1293 RepID=UPI001A7E0EB1
NKRELFCDGMALFLFNNFFVYIGEISICIESLYLSHIQNITTLETKTICAIPFLGISIAASTGIVNCYLS